MNIIRKTLLVILLLFLPQTLYAQNLGKFKCVASHYINCLHGNCIDNVDYELEIYVDLTSKIVLRETTGKEFFNIKDFWIRPENHLYILYEDPHSHGFIVINTLDEKYYDYADTLYTNVGGYVSSGYCKPEG